MFRRLQIRIPMFHQSYVSEVADKNSEFMATAINLIANGRAFNAFMESFQDVPEVFQDFYGHCLFEQEGTGY